MKKFRIILLTILSSLCLINFAQVRQTFRVTDFNTGKPLGGARSELYGITLTTNSEGIATATLQGDQKGAFLPVRDWQLEGYRFFGATEKSLYQYLQTKDTINYYLISNDIYYEYQNRLMDSIFTYWYINKYLLDNKELIDSALALGINGSRFANKLYGNCFIDNNIVETCHSGANDINNPLFLRVFDKKHPEITQKLFSGDIKGATKTAGVLLKQQDPLHYDLSLIDLYRSLRYIDNQADTLSLSDFSRVLQERRKDNPSMVKYLYDLNKDERYSVADSLAAIWKRINDNPLLSVYFTPGLAESFDMQDVKKIKTLSDDMLGNSLNNCQKYPCEESEEILLNSYLNAVYSGLIINDSTQVEILMDTVVDFIHGISMRIDDDLNRSQFLIEQYNKAAQFFEYATEETKAGIVNNYAEALKEIYNHNGNLTSTQLQIAEYGYNILRYVEDENIIGQLLNLVYDANKNLCKRFPLMFSVRNMQVSSQLLGKAVSTKESSEALDNAFKKYRESFIVVDSILPYCFVNNFLDFNSTIDGYLAYNQSVTLIEEISAFTDLLLRRKAEANNNSFYAEKAQFFNSTAEKLYSSELYEESIAYYLQANEFYEKVLQSDDKYWSDYLRNYLQMGDAHHNLNQFDKAIMTYGRVFDFENNIPKTALAEYTFMKGSAHYYTGDAYKSQNNLKIAEKEYKLAEKEYNKAISLGNKDANATMGEMYFGKAVSAAQEGNMKKNVQLVDKSVKYYEASNLERPYRTYEKAKSSHKDFAKQSNDIATYRKDLEDLSAYYKKFFPVNNNYAGAIYDISNEMLSIEDLDGQKRLQCAEDMADALIVLHDQGYNVDRYYFRTMNILANEYLQNDSVRKAVLTYRDAYNINTLVFKDTAKNQWEYNSAVIYENLASCYEKMAEVTDTARKELWYYRAIDTRDTAIQFLTPLSDDGDENFIYRIASNQRENAGIFYRLDMILSAIDRYDRANELLTKLYNSEYKSDVEGDIIRNYAEKGLIYNENNDKEKAAENLRTAISFAEKAERPTAFSLIAAIELNEILKEDKERNSAEISKLTKFINEYKKSIK